MPGVQRLPSQSFGIDDDDGDDRLVNESFSVADSSQLNTSEVFSQLNIDGARMMMMMLICSCFVCVKRRNYPTNILELKLVLWVLGYVRAKCNTLLFSILLPLLLSMN